MPITKLINDDWRNVFKDITTIDTLFTDPPYSDRTHAGSIKASTMIAGDHIDYNCFTEENCQELVEFFAPRVNNWFVIFGDHWTNRWYEKYLTQLGLYVFAPVYYLKINPMPRMQGDGPTSSVEIITRACTQNQLLEMAANVLHANDPRLFELNPEERVITVARHKVRVVTPKSRRGHYLAKVQQKDTYVAGQKDLETACEVLADYSDPGDMIADPFAGCATFSRACQIMGRSSIATELRPHIHHMGKVRLAEPIQPRLIG
jgi:DNA methylase